MELELAGELARGADTKIVLFVMDGLGGLPHAETGRTELETAYIPHLDRVAKESVCGFTLPVGPGITPGSGPGHLALFGYDPLKFNIGRGVLEAAGIDFDLQPSDVAARGNFCTVDGTGRIVDRRAGRISTEDSARLVAGLRDIRVDALKQGSGRTEVFIEPVREHRFVLVLRGDGLSDAVADTDPQAEGAQPLPVRATAPEGEATAAIVRDFVQKSKSILADKHPVNALLLRGFAKRPDWPPLSEVFKLNPAAVAYYPMYRGLARLVGMQTLAVGPGLGDSLATLR